jgi:hypothetical protein
VAVRAVASTKALVRDLTFEAAADLAEQMLATDTAGASRKLAEDFLAAKNKK